MRGASPLQPSSYAPPPPPPSPATSAAPSTAIPKSAPSPQPITTPSPLTSSADLDHTFVGKTGGEIFHEMIRRQNVKCVFGYPGGAILPVFDAIYDSPHFEFILPRHEQGAGHMAEGYARASGKPGVVLVTSGPGATNTVTPMQDALSDGTPMVVFCGQVPTNAIGTDAFQEADVIGITRSCTKWNVMVKDIAELPRRITEAFHIATSGRPGPVLVDLPKDVTAGTLMKPIPRVPETPKLPGKPANFLSPHLIQGSDMSPQLLKTLERTAEMINKAKRPVIYAGQGILATPEGPQILREFANIAQIPVTTTLQGLGAFPETSHLSLHMLGMHGSAYANLSMQNADVIIALGARFDDRVTGFVKKFAPTARAAGQSGTGGIIHFEILPKNINKVIQANEIVEGDVASNLAHLLPLIQPKTPENRENWFGMIDEWKRKYPFQYERAKEGEVLKPQQPIEMLNELCEGMKDDVVITTGVGQHQMWAAQYYRWTAPRTFITSGGLGTMGFGVPSAIGAKAFHKSSKEVIDIDGDASFAMTAMELVTAAQYNIGAKVMVLNNEFQGMVKQWQDLWFDQRYSGTEMKNPHFMKLADAFGIKGISISRLDELKPKMKEFLEHDGPTLLEVKVCKKEHVYPMVPAGKALDEMVMGPPKEL